MAITPIEMISMVPKSQEASTVRHTEQQRPVHEQVHLQQKLEKETKHNEKQTVRAKDTENPEYRYDAKEKGKNSYSDQNKNKKNDHKSNETNETSEDKINYPKSSFDVSI